MKDISGIAKDFSLPIDEDNESVVISSAIQSKENLDIFCKRVDYRELRKLEYKTIAYALHEIHDKKLEVNIDAILLYSKSSPVNSTVDYKFINELTTNFPVVPKENLEEHITNLKTSTVKANVVQSVFSSIYKDCLDPKTDLTKIDKDVEYVKTMIKNGFSSNKLEFKNTEELVIDYIAAKARNEEKRTTGYSILDKHLVEGFKEGQITTVCALPGLGKSSFVLSMMNNLGNKKIPTAQFAMEMPNMSIMHKFLAFGSRLPINTVIHKPEDLNHEELIAYEEAIRMLKLKSIYLNDKPTVPLSYIREQITMLQDMLKTQYIVISIDLFGKIKDLQGSDNFARDYEKVLNETQRMVRELGVHMILVAQINRSVAHRKWSRPKMSDLKNAGALEEVSDLIFGIHRPNYDPEVALRAKFKKTETDLQHIEESPDKDLAEIIFLKQRMGEGNLIINFKFDPDTTRFIPFDDEEQEFLNSQKFNEDD